MFSLLTNSQIYGLQAAHEQQQQKQQNNTSEIDTRKAKSNSLPPLKPQQHQEKPQKKKQHRRSTSSLSDSAANTSGSRFFASLSSMQGMKSPTNFIEKFIKSDLLSGYDTLKNYQRQNNQNIQSSNGNSNESNGSVGELTGGGAGGAGGGLNSGTESLLNGFNCLQGSYRSNGDSDFYEAVQVNTPTTTRTATTTNYRQHSKSPTTTATTTSEMTIRCSKNLLAVSPQAQGPATLQNYQKLPEYAQDLVLDPRTTTTTTEISTNSSGASSGEFNTESAGHTPSNNLYKKLSFGARLAKHGSNSRGNGANGGNTELTAQTQLMLGNEINSDNSSSSHHSTSTSRSKSSEVQRSSSGSSTSANADGCKTDNAVRKKSVEFASEVQSQTPERIQRRKLLQMISAYEQQNKLLQRELAKEKRRRTEELACVVKSLICFESKLKTDMKAVNQRLAEKDTEICRLVRQNRALRKRLASAEDAAARDEGVVVGGDEEEEEEDEEDEEKQVQNTVKSDNDELLMADCLVLEALQCINCRKQFYDIELKENCTQTAVVGTGTVGKELSCSNRDNVEHLCSSSDDTASSSFYGARRSVRYTSKRTSGNFRDYMRSRAMNIDDPALEQGSEENTSTSTISREDSQTSYEQLHHYSRAIERMHGVVQQAARLDCLDSQRCASRLSNKSSSSSSRRSSSSSSKSSSAKSNQIEEDDDGIFSPTQDDEDFEVDDDPDELIETETEEQRMTNGIIKIVPRRAAEFSEATPKQIYETSTDDWYASASDQEEHTLNSKSYGHGAVNPVLECVNQILLQQSMEEATVHELPKILPTKPTSVVSSSSSNLPRRSSLSGRRSSIQEHTSSMQTQRPVGATLTRKRVHFSTKNSMVHVPRNDEDDDDEDDVEEQKATDAAKRESDITSTSSATTDGKLVPMISQHYHTMNASVVTAVINTTTMTTPQSPVIAAETLNYESIYSNEYEPIGSERTSNLYVDMDAATNLLKSTNIDQEQHELADKFGKLPPALPPKPANLLKFKKPLQQLEEEADEHDCATSTTTTTGEPDYCSISEVNVRVTSVQIVADVHKAPASVAASELDLEVSTVASDDTFAASQKTEEIEEIFADIPKLPNVAAIIAPKHSKYHPSSHTSLLHTPTTPQSDYLIMTPKSTSTAAAAAGKATPLKLQLSAITPNSTTNPTGLHHYKRKHMPNILAEINKRMSLPSSPTTPTNNNKSFALHTPNRAKSLHKLEDNSPNLPLQAEFDWYNLDAEYGKTTTMQPDLLKTNDSCAAGGMLAEIQEVSESIVAGADEYNLDEEFNLAAEDEHDLHVNASTELAAEQVEKAIKLSNSFSSTNGNSDNGNQKTKKMQNNLANFEKFIEGSGLSTKPLPSKRKIYFSGPFV